jgi:hypothetical protein
MNTFISEARQILSYQYIPPINCSENIVQILCEHNEYFIMENHILKCNVCEHYMDVQLLLLNVPSFISISLCEIYINCITDLLSTIPNMNADGLLCRVVINLPDNPTFVLLLTYSEYQLIFRLLAMCIGSFCNLQYNGANITDSDMHVFESEIVPIVYDCSEPRNATLLANFSEIYSQLIIHKANSISQMAADDNMSELLKLTCTIFKNLQNESLKQSKDPIMYMRENLLTILQVVQGKPFIKSNVNCITKDGMPRRYSYEWFEFFFELFVQIRAELGCYVMKLDIFMSIIPIMGLFASHSVPERLESHMTSINEASSDKLTMSQIFLRESSLKSELSVLCALSFPSYWMVKMAFGHYDNLFKSTYLFNATKHIMSKYLGSKLKSGNRSHSREYYYMAKNARLLSTAPDSETINLAMKLVLETENEIKYEIQKICDELGINVEDDELKEIFCMLMPSVIFYYDENCDGFEVQDSYYMFKSTYWIKSQAGTDKVTNLPLGKYKASANRMATALKDMFAYIRNDMNCVYIPNSNDVYLNFNEKSVLNIQNMNPLFATNLISKLQEGTVFHTFVMAMMAILHEYKPEEEISNFII